MGFDIVVGESGEDIGGGLSVGGGPCHMGAAGEGEEVVGD